MTRRGGGVLWGVDGWGPIEMLASSLKIGDVESITNRNRSNSRDIFLPDVGIAVYLTYILKLYCEL